MDKEILDSVHSVFGEDVKIVDCQKTSSVMEQEVLLINGVPIKLDEMSGDDATAIKNAFREGQMPSVELLNQLFQQAGLIQQAVQLDTSMTVKSSLITKEKMQVSRHGHVLDERTNETEEVSTIQSHQSEILYPIVKKHTLLNNKPKDKLKFYASDSSSSVNNQSFGKLDSSSMLSSSREYEGCSTFSNYSTNNSFSSDKTYGLDCASNLSTATTYGDCSENKSSTSCDSGHDGNFKSESQKTEVINVPDDQLTHLFHSVGPLNYRILLDKEVANLIYRPPQSSPTGSSERNCDKTLLLAYHDHHLISGCLESLITHLVPKHEYFPASHYINAFLLSARIFLTPKELLRTVLQIWEHQQKIGCPSNESHKLSHQQHEAPSQLMRLLEQWSACCPADFWDARFLEQIELFVRKFAYLDPSIISQAQEIIQKLSESASVQKNYKRIFEELTATLTRFNKMQHWQPCQPLEFIESAATHSSSQNTPAVEGGKDLLDLCANPLHLAHQLTAIELAHMSSLRVEHLVQYLANEAYHDGQQTCVGDTSDVVAYLEWSTRLSYLTATEIVKFSSKKQRARVVEFWIETARECFNIGNFNSLLAILAGLSLPAVARLKKMWSKVPSAKFEALKQQMDSSQDFNTYRSTIKAAVWRSKCVSIEKERILIPYFDLFVKDLLFLYKSCSKMRADNHIDFQKCSYFAAQLSEFSKWQAISCPYAKLPKVLTFLQHTALLNADTIAKASFSFESPKGADEKQLYKQLKSKQKN